MVDTTLYTLLDNSQACANALTVEEVLEHLGVGAFTVQLVTVCGLGWLCDTAWITVIISITVPIEYEFGTGSALAGSLLSILFGAQGVGALIFGPISDAKGRSFAFAASLLVSTVGGVGVALSNSFGLLVACVVVAGIGVGGNLPVDGALVAELSPKSVRGRLMTLLTVFWSLGSVLVYLVAWALIPAGTCASAAGCDPSHNDGWRYVVWAMSGLCFASLLSRIGFPESASWLLSAGRPAEAVAVLQRIGRMNGRPMPPQLTAFSGGGLRAPCSTPSPPAAGVALPSAARPDGAGTAASPSEASASQAQLPRCKQGVASEGGPSGLRAASPAVGECSPLRSPACGEPGEPTSADPGGRRGLWAWADTPGMRRTLGMLAVLWPLSNFGYGLFNSMNLVLTTAKLGDAPTGNAAYEHAIVESLGGVLGALLGAVLVDTRLGRRGTLLAGVVAVAGSCGVFMATASAVGVVLSGALLQLTAQVMYAALYLYTPEVLPLGVRASGVAALSCLSRVAGIVAPVVGHAIFAAGVTANGVVGISLISMGLMAGAAALLPIETRGRDLM